MTRRTALPCLLASLTLWLAPTPLSFAWGDEGHCIICAIASQRLSPAGLAVVAEVRALSVDIEDPFRDCHSCSPAHEGDGRTMSFLQGCIWPDESRRDTFKGTYEYHFINAPNTASGK